MTAGVVWASSVVSHLFRQTGLAQRVEPILGLGRGIGINHAVSWVIALRMTESVRGIALSERECQTWGLDASVQGCSFAVPSSSISRLPGPSSIIHRRSVCAFDSAIS